MPGRRNRVPNVYNLHIPIEIAAHTQTAHALLAAVIKHLTFAREQCHAPYTQLEVHAQACQQQQEQQMQQGGRRKQLSSSARKAVKYYERLSAMLEAAANIPHQQLQGMAVSVLLGSSVQRPREVYCMHFPPAMQDAAGGVPPPSTSAVSAATRKLLRALVMEHETISEWDEPAGPTKMWLLFQAPDGVLQAAPEGFTIRRAFSINLRKAFQVNLLLGGQTPGQWEQQHKQPQQQQQQQQQQHPQPVQQQQQPHHHHMQQPALSAAGGSGGLVGMEVDNLSQQLTTHMSIRDAGSLEACPVWFQCSVHVKGLKPASSSH